MASSSHSPSVVVRLADLDSPQDHSVVLELLNHYAMDPLALGGPLPEQVQSRLIQGLRQFPTARVFIADSQDAEPMGLATCFVGFSTFQALPLINIHDLVVRDSCRGLGVGSRLIDAIVEYSNQNGFCAVTLEVRCDNPARRLYERKGFRFLELPVQQPSMLFAKLTLSNPNQ
jgi:ribosomal protein S18 acetylase RimI-like enzyme